MYICGELFYGIPLHFLGYGATHSPFMKELKGDYYDAIERIEGLQSFYHGGADEKPLAFGVHVKGLDTCDSHYDIDLATFNPENIQKYQAQFDVLWNKLDETTQKEFSAYGPARLFILWSSS